VPNQGCTNGIGDVQFSAFLSPATPGDLIWGVGAITQLPTHSDRSLGNDNAGLGPTFVVLHLSHGDPWVVGQGSAGSSPSHPLWRQRYGGLLRLGQARKDPVDQSASRPVG